MSAILQHSRWTRNVEWTGWPCLLIHHHFESYEYDQEYVHLETLRFQWEWQIRFSVLNSWSGLYLWCQKTFLTAAALAVGQCDTELCLRAPCQSLQTTGAAQNAAILHFLSCPFFLPIRANSIHDMLSRGQTWQLIFSELICLYLALLHQWQTILDL